MREHMRSADRGEAGASRGMDTDTEKPANRRVGVPVFAAAIASSCCALVAAGGNLQTSTAATAALALTAQPTPVPARPAWQAYGPRVVWHHTETAGAQASRAVGRLAATRVRAGDVVIGLKRPGQRRGVWEAELLIGRAEAARYAEQLERMGGIQVGPLDPDLPFLPAHVANEQVLASVARLPFVDYIDARHADIRSAAAGLAAPGCAGNRWTKPSAHTRDGDVIPWSYFAHGIPAAWRRTQGGSLTVAVLDVGVSEKQDQLTTPAFPKQDRNGRWVWNTGSNKTETPWATCDHGTRVAGVLAAPLDGKNIVGVAYRANLITVNQAPYIVVGPTDTLWIVRAIEKARAGPGGSADGARIINMAFGSPVYLNAVADKIRFEYARRDRPHPIFVVAIGSFACPLGNGRLFPASMRESLTVAGVTENGATKVFSSCSGALIGGVVGAGDAIETTGAGAADVVGLGASSGGTAIISGIIALIWSEHPNWTREQVVVRLTSSARRLVFESQLYSAPNAYAAVGGFADLRLRGPQSAEERTAFTLTATPTGDGPFYYRWSTGASSPSISLIAGRRGTSGTYSVTVTDAEEHAARTAVIRVAFRASGTCKPKNGQECVRRTEPAALAGPGAVRTSYTEDRAWRATVHAWARASYALRQIGATVTVQHRELVCGSPLCTGGKRWMWVNRPATLSIRNEYEQWPRRCPCVKPSPPRTCQTRNQPALTCSDVAAAAAGAARWSIQSVTARAHVDIGDGVSFAIEPVSARFPNGDSSRFSRPP